MRNISNNVEGNKSNYDINSENCNNSDYRIIKVMITITITLELYLELYLPYVGRYND